MLIQLLGQLQLICYSFLRKLKPLFKFQDWWIRLHGDRLPRSIEELEQCQRQVGHLV